MNSAPLLVFLAAAILPLVSAKAAPLTAEDYTDGTVIQGWTVRVEKSLESYPRRAEAMALLETNLAEIAKLLPPSALPKLKQVPIWLSRNVAPGACYHPSADWLKSHGRVVEMARSIELQNMNHFLDWSARQPLMLLHELAHAWQDQELAQGYGNPEIKAAFEAAKASGKYEKVRHIDGREIRHYALSNPMEYFAECSEAYFGKNDFQPFTREELKTFDPGGYQVVEKQWGIATP